MFFYDTEQIYFHIYILTRKYSDFIAFINKYYLQSYICENITKEYKDQQKSFTHINKQTLTFGDLDDITFHI